MKKKAQSSDDGKRTREKSLPAKSARIIPSRMWGQGALALWRSLSFRERTLIVMGIFVPALDQISRLGSLGVTMKAVGMGIREPLDPDMRLLLGLIILGATGITALIQIFSGRVKKGLKVQNTRLIRRIYGGIVAEAGKLPHGDCEEEVKHLINEERNFMNSAMSGVSALIEFFAAIFLVLILLGILTWFDWIVGVTLLVAGLVALVVLKHRIKSAPQKENEELTEARIRLTQKLESIAWRRDKTNEMIEDYVFNDFDQITMAEAEAKTKLQKKITTAMNFGSAVLVAGVFLLVSAEGAFDENKIVWMVVFIFGLRMVISFGKMAMVKWGSILVEKNSMMMLAKAGFRSSASAAEAKPELEAGASWSFPLGDRILVLGDGHVRSYAENSNFFPVFLGPGKVCNFTSDQCADYFTAKALTMLERVSGKTVLLVLGEPDTRFALGRGWLPWETRGDAAIEVGAHTDQESMSLALERSVERARRTVDTLAGKYAERSFFIAPVFPVEMPEQRDLIAKFNLMLQSSFGPRFLAVNEAMQGVCNHLGDRVHQSNGIQPLIEHELIGRGVIDRLGNRSVADWDANAVHQRFKRNERFGCYMYDHVP